MSLTRRAREALEQTGLEVTLDAPLAGRVWWRVGGPADALVTATTPAEVATVLATAAAHDLPVLPVGVGSNLLVADAGVRGVVLLLDGALRDTERNGDLLVAGAGLRVPVLLARAARDGWAGLACLAGIPGTVGGAVRMNAGTSLGEIADRLAWVEVALPSGAIDRLPPDRLGFAYRASALPPSCVVTRVALRIDGDAAADAERARTFLARRKATQPLDKPSCGSTFTNPSGDAAGRLIEAAGLKGVTHGGAQVSPMHANFVLNLGTATARDLAELIARVQDAVEAHSGVLLEPEVVVVGDWGPDGCPIRWPHRKD